MAIDDEVLDVSDALDDWTRPTTIKTVTVTTVDFEKVEQVAGRTQECMIQPANPAKLSVTNIDLSLRYILVHSPEAIAVKELVEYDGADFEVIQPAKWKGYGYAAVVAAEVKGPVKAVNV